MAVGGVRARAIGVAVAGSVATMSVAPASQSTTGGAAGSLRTAPVVDLTTKVAAADPVPTSGLLGGRALSAPAAHRRSQALWSAEESGVNSGLLVYDDTASGTFSLTGTVAGPSGDPVAGASVTVGSSRPGAPAAGRAVTDADGAFAFVDVPVAGATERFDLEVRAAGFGRYRVIDDVFRSNRTYQTSVAMTATEQLHDGSALSRGGTERAASGRGGYGSTTAVPGSIRVRIHRQVNGCAAGSYLRTERYPWKFYVLHVAAAEISSLWYKRAFRANASAIQNYAWAHRLAGSPLNNTTQYQCFKPWLKVPTEWAGWLRNVLDERVVASGIQVTQYRAGTYACRESLYRRNGNIMSQNGSRARANINSKRCGRRESWRGIVRYYYSGRLRDGRPPRTPTRSWARRPGAVDLDFNAPGAWRYLLQRYPSACKGGKQSCWGTVYERGWSWRREAIPRSRTAAADRCFAYRVAAVGPSGRSHYGYYNGGHPICPK